jgi:poly-beta-1,6-N-acetyl-D-glucosamine synthase
MTLTFLDTVLFTTYFILLFLAIFWLIVFLSPNNQDSKKKKLSRNPLFTAIVPAMNEATSIAGTLQSLVNLDYPPESMEIIVSINASTDNTKQVVEKFISGNKTHNIKFIESEIPGKGKAMNRALQLAKGEFFACLDADSFIHSNALQEMLPLFEADKNVASVCPLMKVRKPNSILQKVQWCEYIINMFYKFLNSKLDAIHVTPGPFSVYRSKVILDLGGYDENTITEDLEIAIRLQKHHYRILQTFDTIVETNAPMTWKSLFRQRVRWYKGSVDNALKYKKLMFNRKYGDFGFIRMPTIILGGAIAIVLFFTLLRELIINIIHWLISIKAINFDYVTVFKNFSLQINFLSLPFFKLTIAATLLGISFFVMIYSYKLVKEDIRNHGKTWLSLITYLSIYSFFITIVWVYIGYMFITRKKNFWT